MALGMNDADRAILEAVNQELREADKAETQHGAMTRLLWARHILDSLLRQMQDD